MTYAEALQSLKLSEGCSITDVRRAYRRLAKRLHPDRFPTFSQQAKATRQFIRTKEAHDVLMAYLRTRGVPDETPPPMERKASEYADSGETSETETFDPFFWLSWLGDRLTTIGEKHLVLELLLLPLLITEFFILALLGLSRSVLVDFVGSRDTAADSQAGSKRDPLAYLIRATIVASLFTASFLLTLYAFKGGLEGVGWGWWNVILTPLVWLSILFFLAFSWLTPAILLFVLSEWISFIVTTLWRRRIATELSQFKNILPVSSPK